MVVRVSPLTCPECASCKAVKNGVRKLSSGDKTQLLDCGSCCHLSSNLSAQHHFSTSTELSYHIQKMHYKTLNLKNVEKLTWDWTLNILRKGLMNSREPEDKIEKVYKKFLKEMRIKSAWEACEYALQNGLSPEALIFEGYVHK